MTQPKRHRRNPTLVALASAAVLGATLTVMAQPIEEPIEDRDITTAIEREFARNDAVPYNRIYVSTESGIVTLTGTVRSLGARERAEAIAGIVRGVSAVVNRVTVDGGGRSADAIRADAQAALASDPATEPHEIEVTVGETGRAILAGQTESWAERMLAERVVATVAGVTEVINQIMVDMSAAFRHETEVEEDVRSRLRWDVRVDDSLIDVLALEGGRVVLSGTVGSLAEKRAAAMLAHVEGTASVDTAGLQVARWARDDDLKRGKYTDVSDSGIREAVRTSLRHDPRVDASRVEVEVDDRDVWLRGEVSHTEASRSAEQNAYNTVGVDYVVNRLRVRPESLDDATIENLLESALRSRDLLDETSGITASVRDRTARLTGDVPSLGVYWAADQAASAVRGLETLNNDLTVRGRKPQIWTKWYGFYPRPTSPGVLPTEVSDLTDRQIHANVRDEIFWSPFVDIEDVSIDVDDGIATLAGMVGSARERQFARQNALEAGALGVRNELTIAN